MTNVKTEILNTNLHELRFNDLGISPAILESIHSLCLTTPTPIQHKTIPVAITGQDVIGIAQTGTGKTLAFGIPMIQRLGRLKGMGLIIAPTRELALQVNESLLRLGKPLGLRTAVLIGGEAIDRQLYQLRKKPHIIIATPGRLIDHLTRRTLRLDSVNTVVLDEADMMLDLGFALQIAQIMDQIPADRQTMLFSATMPVQIVKMASKYMKTPVSIEVARPGTTAAQIDQEIFIIKSEERFNLLEKILGQYSGSVLIFLRTKHTVKALTKKLQQLGHKAVEIHSNLSLNRRKAALNDFKSKKERIMVATDVAARGLDISDIALVVNYNLPDNREDYVHRIGRTGRAGRSGKAISFATPDEHKDILAIEKLINKSIKRTEFARLNPVSRAFDSTNYQRKAGQRASSRRKSGRNHSDRLGTTTERSEKQTSAAPKKFRHHKPWAEKKSYGAPRRFRSHR